MERLSLHLPLFIATCFLFACTQDPTTEPAAEWLPVSSQRAAGFDPEKLAQLDRLISGLNTQSVFVVAGGKLLYQYGDVTDTGYVASVRKSILALLYGPYVIAGEIDLDATLGELGIDDHQGLLDIERRARVRDLISARSGVYHPAANGGDSAAEAPPRGPREPGTYFLYNNWDFNAAGGIFEQETGQSVYDALDRDIAKPLQFQDFDRDYQELHGDRSKSRFLAYHMFLSARDLARIGLLMLRGGKWRGKQLYPQSWIEMITSEVTDVQDMNPETQRNAGFDYGYMWWIFDDRTAAYPYRGAYLAQGSYGQFLLVVPELDLVIVHKTRYRPINSKREYDAAAVSYKQFKIIADAVIGARLF